jgi:hypothetical protein
MQELLQPNGLTLFDALLGVGLCDHMLSKVS